MLTSTYLKSVTIQDLQHALTEECFTSEDLVRAYLRAIDANNRNGLELCAHIDVCPQDVILPIARGLDQERKDGRIRGKMHGIPIVLKDSIDTHPSLGMRTTAGSYALGATIVQDDAILVTRLRDAGALILAKANLDEFGNRKRENPGSKFWGGWSAVGGQTKSPIARQMKANPDGSSTGSAIAVLAGFAPAAIGVETCGSITDPARRAGLYALKPTVGLISQSGIVPISKRLDSAGPMAKSPADLAIVLDILAPVQKGCIDPADPIERASQTYVDCARLGETAGVANMTFAIAPDPYLAAWTTFPGEQHHHQLTINLFWSAITQLQEAGLSIVRPALPPFDRKMFDEGMLTFRTRTDCEMKDVLNDYLSQRIGNGPRSLAEVIEFNQLHADLELPEGQGGQEQLERVEATLGLLDPMYETTKERLIELSKTYSPQAMMESSKAGIFAGVWYNFQSRLASFDQLPTATMPIGTIEGVPIGMTLFARKGAEGALLQVMTAWETIRGDASAGNRGHVELDCVQSKEAE